MNIVPISKEYVRTTLEKQGVVCVTGIYGSGKGLIADWLIGELTKEGNRVVRMSFKDLPTPTIEDIPVVVGYKNYVQLHAKWRKLAEGMGKRRKKLILVIEEVQQILPNGEDFWRVLESLHYYQKDSIRVVMTAQPAVLGISSVHWKALISSAIIYPRRLTQEEIGRMVGSKSKYLTAIVRLSHGHYGTVKYIAKLLELSEYTGKYLTEVQVVKWAKEAGMVEQFGTIVWSGLSQSQRRVIKQYITQRGRIASNLKGVKELISCGMFYRGGRRLHFYTDWLIPFVREYVTCLPKERRLDLAWFGRKEKLLVEALQTNQAKVMRYSDLADAIWGEKADKYSLWALSRLVSRVKKKLQDSGYLGVIVTERGVGYRWVT